MLKNKRLALFYNYFINTDIYLDSLVLYDLSRVHFGAVKTVFNVKLASQLD